MAKHFDIEISADLSNLKRAFRETNIDIKKNSTELNKFTKALKGVNGANFTLLQSQAQVAGDRIEILQKKLAKLKEAEKRFLASNSDPTKVKGYRELQLEIVKTENELKKAGVIVKDFNSTSKEIVEFQGKFKVLNGEIKNNLKSLNELNKLSKDTSGLSKLEINKEKYKQLEIIINQTKDKIKLLIAEQNRMKFDKVSQGSAEYKKIAQEIKKAKAELSGFKENQSKVSISGQLSKALSDASNKFRDLSQRTQGISLGAGLALGASIKSFVDFEKAMVGVKKTVDPTEEEFRKLTDTAIKMSQELPNSSVEIANLMKTAGQLGISKKGIGEFTRTIIDLSNATNIIGEDGAEKMAKFANVTKMSEADYRKFGSSIVDLGNNFATTEQDILDMSTRLGASAKMAGLSVPDILGLSTAMTSVGISAEEGGSAMTKVINYMQTAIVDTSKTGQEHLEALAKVTGKTTEEFKESFKNNATGTLQEVINGFQKMDASGGSVIKTLKDMGINNIREQQTITKLASAGDLLTKAIDTSGKAWQSNTALTKESNASYQTTGAKLKILQNRFVELARQFGEKMKPGIDFLIKALTGLTKALSGVSPEVASVIAISLTAVASLSAVFKTLEILSGGLSFGIGMIGKFKDALILMSTNPWILGLTVALTGLVAVWQLVNAESEKTKQKQKELADSFNQSFDSVKNAEQNAVSEYQKFQETIEGNNKYLEENKQSQAKVEKEIKDIIAQAIKEKRGLYDTEIEDIKNKNKKLQELKEVEKEIHRATADAINTISVEEIKSYQGDVNGLYQLLQNKLKTVEDAQKQELDKLKETHTLKIVELNKQYDTEDKRNSQEYQDQLTALNKNYKDQQDATTAHYDKLKQDLTTAAQDRKDILKEHVDAEQWVADETERIMNDAGDKAVFYYNNTNERRRDATKAEKTEDDRRNEASEKAWQKYVGNMTQAEKDQAVVQANILKAKVLSGGKLTDEEQKIADKLLKITEHLPEDQKKRMEDVFNGMVQGVKDKKGDLFAVFGTAMESLKKILPAQFKINSPSRVTRKHARGIMEGIQRGLEDETKQTLNTMNKITKQLNTGFSDGLDNKFFNMEPSFVNNTKTILTTPNITFNVKQMTNDELDRACEYVNRKLGGAY